MFFIKLYELCIENKYNFYKRIIKFKKYFLFFQTQSILYFIVGMLDGWLQSKSATIDNWVDRNQNMVWAELRRGAKKVKTEYLEVLSVHAKGFGCYRVEEHHVYYRNNAKTGFGFDVKSKPQSHVCLSSKPPTAKWLHQTCRARLRLSFKWKRKFNFLSTAF